MVSWLLMSEKVLPECSLFRFVGITRYQFCTLSLICDFQESAATIRSLIINTSRILRRLNSKVR